MCIKSLAQAGIPQILVISDIARRFQTHAGVSRLAFICNSLLARAISTWLLTCAPSPDPDRLRRRDRTAVLGVVRPGCEGRCRRCTARQRAHPRRVAARRRIADVIDGNMLATHLLGEVCRHGQSDDDLCLNVLKDQISGSLRSACTCGSAVCVDARKSTVVAGIVRSRGQPARFD